MFFDKERINIYLNLYLLRYISFHEDMVKVKIKEKDEDWKWDEWKMKF